MTIKIKKEGLLAIGMLSLAFSFLVEIFAGEIPIIDFLCGFFTSLSITLNIGFLIKLKYEMNTETKN